MAADLNSLRIDKAQKSTPARSNRWIWAIPIAAILLTAGYFLYPAAAMDVQVVRVALTQSSAATEDVTLNATGYIVAAHKIELAPKVNGRAAQVNVDMGDKVKKGEILVQLEDEEFQAQVKEQQGQLDAAKAKLAELQNGSRPQEIAQAKAELEQAQADLTNAQSNLNRTRDLMKSKAVSQQTLDDAQATFDKAKAKVDSEQAAYEMSHIGPRQEQIDAQKAQVEQAEGFLDLVKVNLENTRIRAPIDGTVLDRNVEVGEYVTTGFVGDNGAKGYVVSLADLNDLRVELDISQNDFNKISTRQHCTVTTDAYPDRGYDGIIDQISPEANRQKATILVKVKILKPDELLRPDMNATVAFHKAAATSDPAAPPASAVFIPASAIHSGNVFIVDNGKAVQKPVETGPTTNAGVKILSGLVAGDLVVIDPPANLQSGRAVHFQE